MKVGIAIKDGKNLDPLTGVAILVLLGSYGGGTRVHEIQRPKEAN